MSEKRLMAKLQRLQAKKDKLAERCKASTDVDEVRALTEQLSDLNDDIKDIQDELDELRAKAKTEDTEERAKEIPDNAKLVNGGVVGGHVVATAEMNTKRSGDYRETMEYRKAFMNYVQRGTAIPEQFREQRGDEIDTADAGAVIPLTVMRDIINTVRVRYGNLYDKVTKTAVKGGVEYPVGDLSATFSWITESTVSPEKDAGPIATVSFGYHTAEIRIAQTFLSALLSIEAFEAKIVEMIAVAYRKAMDTGIVRGSGKGQMLGILNDTRVTSQADHSITMTAAQFNDWTAWRKRVIGAIPLGYRGGEFIFPMSTVDKYLETMADSNNNPIFRQATGLEVNDGDAANPNGRFFGHDISIVEPDIVADFDSASAGDVVGIYWIPSDYYINENFGFTMRRYFDEGRNKWITKALIVVDGKLVNTKGVYLIKKA